MKNPNIGRLGAAVSLTALLLGGTACSQEASYTQAQAAAVSADKAELKATQTDDAITAAFGTMPDQANCTPTQTMSEGDIATSLKVMFPHMAASNALQRLATAKSATRLDALATLSTDKLVVESCDIELATVSGARLGNVALAYAVDNN